MAVIEKSPDYRIDRRVSIALDALDDRQKQAVGSIIADRDHFLASAADNRKVRRISKINPLYTLSVPPGLRIIYSKVGQDIVVMDLMRQATLDKYGTRQSSARRSGTKKTRPASQAKKAR